MVRLRAREAIASSVVMALVLVVGSSASAADSARVPASKISQRAAGGSAANPTTPGEQVWASRYNGSNNDYDQPRAIAVSPDGGSVFVAGFTTPPGTIGSFATFAYDAVTGSELWSRFYQGGLKLADTATALGVSPDGSRVFVTGTSAGLDGDYDFATVAYDASSGDELWVSRYDSPLNGDEEPTALKVSPDGNRVFVSGSSRTSTPGSNYATVAYAASTGAQRWTRQLDGPVHRDDIVHGMDVSPDGTQIFVTGESVGPGTNCGQFYSMCTDYLTVAYGTSTGAKEWQRRWAGPLRRRDTALAVAVSADGSSVFVTGSADHSTHHWEDYLTVAYDASTGTQRWTARYNDPTDSQDYPRAIGVSPDGTEVFVTGFTWQGQTRFYDYGTVAYDASTGAQLWATGYDGPQGDDDEAFALAVSPDGSTVFVTGRDDAVATGYDFATVAYDSQSGDQVWLARYDAGVGSANDDEGFALCVSPDGSRVFVTGESTTPTTSFDIATVAYSTV